MTPKETLTNLFNDIADAIREKDGTTAEIVANTFPARIRAIPTGIGGVQLEYITITAPPTKIYYLVGEEFDPTGMAVYATYSNGQTMYVNHSNLTFDPSGPLEDGATSVTVNFQWGLKMVSATQPITLYANACFGVMWDYSNESTALTRLAPESDPNGYVTVTVLNEPSPATGDGPGSSFFDDYMPWSGMEEYNIIDGVVSYKKGESGFSRENDTVVYIPEFWYTCLDDKAESKRYWYISNRQIDEMDKHPGSKKYIAKYKVGSDIMSKTGTKFYSGQSLPSAKTKCATKGEKFSISTIQVWSAIQILYLMEFANWDSQRMIGNGVFGSSPNVFVVNGKTDAMNYHTGKVSTDEWPQIQYRGIEGVFGNGEEMLDGLKITDKVISVSIDGKNYNDVGTYVENGSNNISGVAITKLLFDENSKYLFIPKENGNPGANKYIPDTLYIDGNLNMFLGGFSTSSSRGGLFCYHASAGASTNYGFRYIFDPEEKAEEVV